MRLTVRPRSIRGKLLTALLVACGPISIGEVLGQFEDEFAGVFGLHIGSIAIWRLLCLCTSAVGFIMLLVLSNRVSRRLRRLSHAARALAVGDFRRRIKMNTNDELEILSNTFNRLGDSLVDHEAELKAQADMLAGMVEAARLISTSLDVKQCGKAIARAAIDHLSASDAAVFRKNSIEGGLKIIGRCGSHVSPTWKNLATHAADSGGYLLMAERRNGDTSEAFLVGVPLSTGTETIGAIVFRFEGYLTREDLRLGSVRADVLTAFGVHVAVAIGNAEVYSQTEKYSEALEDWVEHLSGVMQVTNAISPSLTLDETLAALAKTTAAVMSAYECVIYLLDRQGLLVVRSCSETNTSFPSLKIKPGSGATGLAFSERRPIAYFDALMSSDPQLRQHAEEAGLRGVLSAPLIVENRAIGAITVYDNAPHQYKTEEIRLLTSIALHAAVIVRNASLYTRESSIAETLQKGLLPETPENCRGLGFASKYMPALDEARVGGDFYDVTELPNGNIGVLIADVSGKGLQAAIHLATCKYMIKALMYTYQDDPAQVLCGLNDSINYYFDMNFFVTVFYGIINPKEGTIKYANAGHPPAMLITQDGKMHACLGSTGIPVGCGHECRYETRNADVEQSDILLLYTDGVTDTQMDGKMIGVEGLHEIVFQSGRCTPRQLIDSICEKLHSDNGSSQKDDIALIAVSFEGISAPINAIGATNEPSHLTIKSA